MRRKKKEDSNSIPISKSNPRGRRRKKKEESNRNPVSESNPLGPATQKKEDPNRIPLSLSLDIDPAGLKKEEKEDSGPHWIYDVFLSFRGEDTRRNFVSHLYSALSNAGISTFLDDEKIDKGQMLRAELWRAIEGSRISILVFSKNYAESRWCLDELEKIMECHRTNGQVVLPIFYDVDPSDVRHQKGPFEKCLEGLVIDLELKTPRNVPSCKKALTEAANLAGWDLRNCGNESKSVKEIVDAVLRKLDIALMSIPNFPVGLSSRVQDVIQLLKSTICVVGIWGMGGIGKTTLAKAIYNEILHKFEHRSFIENIRERAIEGGGQISLQEKLLVDILKTRKKKIQSIEEGRNEIKSKLHGKRALVVLDDVNMSEQLEELFGKCEWIGSGSVIIITTRDVRLLKLHGVNYVHEMKEMDKKESLELFHRHAFKGRKPKEDFIELSRNVVAYCGGLPLALEVLGSYLYDRTKEEWKDVLSRLERIPDNQIQKKLKISFDGLEDDLQKDIFLDICCFFIDKDRAYVTDILNGCGLCAGIGITILIERSLLKVEKNKLRMHALLRDMGREIVRESSPKELGKRSRLWFYEDVEDVLTENTGTEAIEGLAFKWQRANEIWFGTNAFERMKRLRLLQLDHVKLNGDNYGYLSKRLRWIYWQGFPLKYMPNNLYQGNLVAIDLKHSNLKLVWKEPQLLERLKILNLSHSRYLTNTPDFSKLPNLEKLILKDCPSLSEVHQSIGDLGNLLFLNMKDCTSLNNLPRTIYKLKSLKTLILSGCSKVDKLEEDIVQMESLTALIAKDTAIKQVPFSIVRSKSIGYISLCGYEGLSRDIFPSLIRSWMSPTMNPLSFIHLSGGMSSSLVSMHVQNNKCGDISQMLSGLSTLRCIWVQCSSEFQLTEDLKRILDKLHDVNLTESEYVSQISDSLNSFWIGMGSYHQVINTFSKNTSQVMNTEGPRDFVLQGDKHSYWLTYTDEGHSVLFEVPQISDCKMKGMILCVIYSATLENLAAEGHVSILIVNHTKCTIQLYKQDTVKSFNEEDWQGIISNLELGDKVEIFAVLGHGFAVKKTTVCLIYGDEQIRGQMEPSLDPKENDFMRPSKRLRM